MLKLATVRKISGVLLVLGGVASAVVLVYLLWLALASLIGALLDPSAPWWGKLGCIAVGLVISGLIIGARAINREAREAEEEYGRDE